MNIVALVISTSLPPFNDSSTLQLIERVQRFPDNGIDTVFIGPELPQGIENSLLNRLPANSSIIRTGTTHFDRTMFWLSQLPGG